MNFSGDNKKMKTKKITKEQLTKMIREMVREAIQKTVKKPIKKSAVKKTKKMVKETVIKEFADNSNVEFLLDGNRGIYLPQDFAQNFNLSDWNINDPELEETLLAGPEEENYWEAWDEVLDNAYMEDDAGMTWRLFQQQDLFMYNDNADLDELQY